MDNSFECEVVSPIRNSDKSSLLITRVRSIGRCRPDSPSLLYETSISV
jgi:hypothetical protein